ncbi:MAG TPA: hypothetical protein VK148_30735 [Xanthobacteraceae bacterium]|jgi:hypothetical protein|nr:hypothetical protein [Xanthobacteraceae bacterium]
MSSEFFGPAYRRSFARLRIIALALFGLVFIANLIAMITFSAAHEEGGDAAAAGATQPWPHVTAQSQLYELPASMTAGSGEKK